MWYPNALHLQTNSTGNSSQAASANYEGKMNIQPSSESELHLYRVLQRANLLQYYHTFISQGTCLSITTFDNWLTIVILPCALANFIV